MKVVLVHNEYEQTGGEEAVVRNTWCLLEENGHEIVPFILSSRTIGKSTLGRCGAFASGIYSRNSRREFRRLIDKHKPDVVHVHNLFPLISPSILPECRLAGLPVVMTVHNHRLVCPNGLHMTGGCVCEKCCGGKEYWCVLRNCERSVLKSLGYALRNYVARRLRLYLDNVNVFIAPSHFQRERLIREGFAAERVVTLSHMLHAGSCPSDLGVGDCIGYMGRISPEKGVATLLEAARLCAGRNFRIAGDVGPAPRLTLDAPPNVEFLGRLEGEALDRFVKSCRFLVVPSLCYETFGLTAAEALALRKPVIASRIGGLPEIIQEERTGLLFEPGNARELAKKIEYLWKRPGFCRDMGEEGARKVATQYAPQRHYEGLIQIYETARRSVKARR